jgi:hypothetical protein
VSERRDTRRAFGVKAIAHERVGRTSRRGDAPRAPLVLPAAGPAA